MNLLSRYTIQTDVFVDRLAMLLIVTQGIEDLGQCEVRETPVPGDLRFENAEKFVGMGR